MSGCWRGMAPSEMFRQTSVYRIIIDFYHSALGLTPTHLYVFVNLILMAAP